MQFKVFLFSLLVLFITSKLFSQNYQTINSGREILFEDENQQIKALRIDSVWLETDSIFFPFANIGKDDMGPCYFHDGPNWIGSTITIKNSGDNCFINLNNDTIFLKTLASLNESWTAFNDQSQYIITATISDIDTLTFLGINDSVKFISFQVFNQELTAIDHPLNSKQIILSKNFGFVKLFNFSLFPDLVPASFENNYFTTLDIIGISNPETGLQNFDALDIYDFQPGDELHIEDYSYNWYINSETLTKMIYKYASRTDFTDSIYYNVEITSAEWKTINGITTYNYWIQTKTEKYYRDNFLAALPDEPFYIEEQMQQLDMTSEPMPHKIHSSSALFENLGDNCWNLIFVNGFTPSYVYYKGLGGGYYNYTGWWDSGYRKLIYYNIGGQTSGTPFVLSETQNFNSKNDFSVFYDNSSDCVKVLLPNINQKTYVHIYNLLGICVISTVINVEQTEISSSKMQNGIYLYEILEGDKILKSGKLIKN